MSSPYSTQQPGVVGEQLSLLVTGRGQPERLSYLFSVTQGVRRDGLGFEPGSSVSSPRLFPLCLMLGRKKDAGRRGRKERHFHCAHCMLHKSSLWQPQEWATQWLLGGGPSCILGHPSGPMSEAVPLAGCSQPGTECGRPCRDTEAKPLLGRHKTPDFQHTAAP